MVGVPQGLDISNILAEIFISDFDKKMRIGPNIYYQRYVDDILILCDKANVYSIAEMVYKELEKLKLKPHPIGNVDSKSVKGDLNASFDYLGYSVEPKPILFHQSNLKLVYAIQLFEDLKLL